MGEPGDGFQAEAPREVIPFIPRANEARETRNGFERGRNTGIPCVGGTGFHAVPNAQFEGGKGMESAWAGYCGKKLSGIGSLHLRLSDPPGLTPERSAPS